MLVFYIILLATVICFVIPFYIEDTWWLYIAGMILIIFGLFIGLAIRSGSNPEIKNYNELSETYNYTISHDSIPFKVKTDLYENCSDFNTQLEEYDKYHENVWIGFYYPELGTNRNKMKIFDITKIK